MKLNKKNISKMYYTDIKTPRQKSAIFHTKIALTVFLTDRRQDKYSPGSF